MRLTTTLLLLLLLTLSSSSNLTVSIPQNTQTPTASPPPTEPDIVTDVNVARVEITSEEEVYLVIPVNQKGVLECTSSSFKDKTLKWLKNEEELISSTEGYRLVEYEVDGTDTSNAGLYTCVTNSEAQTTVKVFIEEPTDTVNPETEDLTTNKGESFELSLPLKVFPVNLINFQMIFTAAPDQAAVQVASYPEQDLSDQVTLSDISNSLRFTISESQPQHHGMYKFIISYGDRTQEHKFFLTVKYKPEIVSFQRVPEFVSLYEDVILTVNVSGYPAPSITWWHAPCCPQQQPVNIKELIMEDPSELNYYHLLNDETLLNLKGGTRRFNGSYWFEAVNEMGSIESSPTYYKLRGYNITVDSVNENNVTSLVQYENVGSLQLTCVVYRDPELSDPQIVWYHNGMTVSDTTSETSGAEMKEILQEDTPGLEAAGTYSCIAQTGVHTLWSFDVEITVVKQPTITVSPQVYRAAEGATVIFSCIVDNIDGVRGQDWGVVYKVKEEDQEFEDVGLTYPSDEENLLYIPQLQTSPEVRCETSPISHVSPVYRDGKVEIVELPPVSVSVITNKQRYTEGDTLIIRCVLLHDIPADSPVDVFWRHGDVKIVTTGGVGVLSDGRVAERYFTTTANNQTTEVLFIEELTKKSAGKYTCVFDGGEKGRYEDSYEISVHPSTPVNTIAIIISVCFVLILIITMGVVLAVIVRRSKTFTYAVAEKQGSPAMQNTAL